MLETQSKSQRADLNQSRSLEDHNRLRRFYEQYGQRNRYYNSQPSLVNRIERTETCGYITETVLIDVTEKSKIATSIKVRKIFHKEAKTLNAFYRDCFGPQNTAEDSSNLHCRAGGDIRPKTCFTSRRERIECRQVYDGIMMAPYTPDSSSLDKRESSKEESNRNTTSSDSKRKQCQSSDEKNKLERSKSNSQASSSGSTYSTRLINDRKAYISTGNIGANSSTYRIKSEPLKTHITNIPNTDNDIDQRVLGKLRDITLKRGRTSFSLFGASDDSTKTRFRPNTRQIKSRHNSSSMTPQTPNPLHHCASESQIEQLSPRRNNRLGDWNKPIQRYNSELKLRKDSKASCIERTNVTRNSFRRFDGLKRNKTNMGNIGGMRRYNSTFALNGIATIDRSMSRDTGSAKTTDDLDDDEDNESQTDRIYEWLINAEDAEEPPEQEIDYNDVPSQTDTALHIVYDGD